MNNRLEEVKKMGIMVWLLAVFFVFLNLMDVGISWLAIQVQTGFIILAPVRIFGDWVSGWFDISLFEGGLLRWLTSDYWSMAITKVLLAVLVAGVLIWTHKRWPGAIRVLAGLNVAWLLLVAWNVYVLRSIS